MVLMTVASEVADDGQEIEVHVGGQDLMVSWHPPAAAPAGWSFPAGRPEAEESWEETLRREVREAGCATVIQARLLGFSRGVCIARARERTGPRALDLASRCRTRAVGPALRDPPPSPRCPSESCGRTHLGEPSVRADRAARATGGWTHLNIRCGTTRNDSGDLRVAVEPVPIAVRLVTWTC